MWTSVSRAPGGPLRYEGVGKEIVHVLKYRGYTRVVDGLAAPLMVDVLGGDRRFDAVVPVPLHPPGSGVEDSTRLSSWRVVSPRR